MDTLSRGKLEWIHAGSDVGVSEHQPSMGWAHRSRADAKERICAVRWRAVPASTYHQAPRVVPRVERNMKFTERGIFHGINGAVVDN